MSKRPRKQIVLGNYIKEESVNTTFRLLKGPHEFLRKFAELANRDIAEVTSMLFLDMVLPGVIQVVEESEASPTPSLETPAEAALNTKQTQPPSRTSSNSVTPPHSQTVHPATRPLASSSQQFASIGNPGGASPSMPTSTVQSQQSPTPTRLPTSLAQPDSKLPDESAPKSATQL